MKNEREYLIEPISSSKATLTFAATFLFAFLFLFGITMGALTFAPLVSVSFFTASARIAELPLSADRIVPFSTASAKTIVNPYPIQIPLVPAYNATEANQNLLRIPAIEVKVPLVASASLADKDIIATLEHGAALYPNGVIPGALGNAFISAHSTGEPWKGPFRLAFVRIDELKAGDAIYVDWNGARYSYRITDSEIVTPTPDFRVISDRPVPTISIMACWPLWSTKQRMLIHAELTNITQLTRPAA